VEPRKSTFAKSFDNLSKASPINPLESNQGGIKGPEDKTKTKRLVPPMLSRKTLDSKPLFQGPSTAPVAGGAERKAGET